MYETNENERLKKCSPLDVKNKKHFNITLYDASRERGEISFSSIKLN
jgi:hypothetical protein